MCRLDEPRYSPLVGIAIGVVVGAGWFVLCATFAWYVVGPALARLIGVRG